MELEDENWRLCSTIVALQCALHSSLLFSVRFPGGAHAASPLTSRKHCSSRRKSEWELFGKCSVLIPVRFFP